MSNHPDSQIPSETVLPNCDDLPYFEDSENATAHVQIIASRIQDGAGPGSCQSAHWRDALLHHGSSRRRLHEAVAALCRLCVILLSLGSSVGQ